MNTIYKPKGAAAEYDGHAGGHSDVEGVREPRPDFDQGRREPGL